MASKMEIRSFNGKTSVLLNGKNINSLVTHLEMEINPFGLPEVKLELRPRKTFVSGDGNVKVNNEVLSVFSTKDIVEELEAREAVEKHIAEPYQDLTVKANGPAIVLVITD